MTQVEEIPLQLETVDLLHGKRTYSFRRSDVADFLLWDFYRLDRKGLLTSDFIHRWRMLPTTPMLGHFPAYVAMLGADDAAGSLRIIPNYSQEPMSRFDLAEWELRSLVEAALFLWEPFLKEIARAVIPTERTFLDAWRAQIDACPPGRDPITLLEEMTRLPWPGNEVHLWTSYFHPSASSLAPHPHLWSTFYSVEQGMPWASWVIGHEGWHTLFRHARNHNASLAPLINSLGEEHEQRYFEEGIGLVLQNRLAVACGDLPEDRMQVFEPDQIEANAGYRFYTFMQQHWEEWRNTSSARWSTLIHFAINMRRKMSQP